MNKLYSVILISLFVSSMTAQIVTITPSFPKRTDEITITFDATLGNKGLQGITQVYAHTGLIVESKSGSQYVQANWGTDDARVKMTSIGNNKHALKIKINDFYKVPTSEKITQLAFVFRNVSGTREGKTATNQDIFVPFTEDLGVLSANLISPIENSFVVNLGDKIPVKVNTSRNVKHKVVLNGVTVHEVTTSSLDYSLAVDKLGTQKVEVVIGEGTEVIEYQFTFTTPPALVKKEVPANSRLGLNLSDKLTFVLAAPGKQYVHLISSLNNWAIDNNYSFNQSPDGNHWWLTIDKPTNGSNILYQYLVDGKIKIADPMSELVLDEANDKFISPFPNQPNYPSGKTSGIVSLANLNKSNFAWTDQSYSRPKKERLNIYELLMRDFISTRSYKTLTDTLEYLKKLGINAIELMPIQEFEGNQSWGYNPSYHMALDKAYGSPDQFKTFVNEAHKRGIAVIQDVVFNHAFSQSPLVQLYWDATLSKPTSNSPYANPDAKHPFNVGFDLNHESLLLQSWMDQVLEFWVKEYHIDGFRFDLSKGFTQRASTDNGVFSNYDASRIAILKRMADQVWKTNKDTYVILEHFATNTEEQELANHGMLLWANYGFNFNEATMGYVDNGKSNVNGLDYRRRSWSVPHQISYMESHDEERIFYKNTQFGNSSGSYTTKDKNTAFKRIAAAAHILLGVPGPKMIWQFGELGYEYSINRCTDGSNNENCRLAEKPIRWDYLQDDARKNLQKSFSTMQLLRNKHEVFHTKNFTLDAADAYKVLTLDGDTLDAVILANFSMDQAVKVINFPKSGKWHEFYTEQILEIIGTPTQNVSLEPGEFRLYFDKKITASSLTTNLKELNWQDEVFIYPNPSKDIITISMPLDYKIENSQIFNISGQMMLNLMSEEKDINVSSLSSGSYYIKVVTNHGVVTKQFLVKH